ncbi:Putative Cell wall mannoprotein [Septoria linicola]|uniref:Cell wall mannoprotein n=1 Tax=Septoria linicola TaxID=215465 RepID=A0A9Q9AHZ8_9PEZI|nr:putative Cell wall mannoprotein [Septoria linicola]USW49744.1 Putative Cell wall mannoprotein [Septoria linicola]
MAPLSSIFAFMLATLAIASPAPAPIAPRQEVITAQIVQQDVKNIDAGVQSLRKHVAAYNGELLSATPLVGDFTAIHLANRAGFLNANLRRTKFTAREPTAIVQTVIDTVGVSIPAAVEETKAKKPLFDQAGLSPVILGTLKVLLDDHDTFSAAVSKDLSADLVRAQAVVDKIHNAIQSGIDFFSA